MTQDWPIEIDPVFGCWFWLGDVDKHGYPRLDGKLAHRTVYAAEHAAIDDGLELDHLCRRRRCVAPHHLEPVDRATNLLRRAWRVRLRALRCLRGHDLTLNVMVTPEGGRVCRACRNAFAGPGTPG